MAMLLDRLTLAVSKAFGIAGARRSMRTLRAGQTAPVSAESLGDLYKPLPADDPRTFMRIQPPGNQQSPIAYRDRLAE